MSVRVKLTRPVERVVLPPVTEVNPNRLDEEVPASPQGFRVYAVEPLDDLEGLAPAGTEGKPLEAFACPGEYEPLGAVIADRRGS